MKGNKGFSLVEMVVAIGILAVVVISSSTLIAQFSKAQRLVSSRDETNEFVVAFNKFLQTPSLCKAALVKVPPIPLTAAFGAISIANFNAYNSDAYLDPSGVPLPVPPLGANFLITKSVRIKTLEIAQKQVAAPNVPFEFFKETGAVDQYRTVAQIKLETVSFDPTSADPNDYRGNPARYFEIPVIVNGNVLPANVVDCTGAVDIQIACTTAGGVWNGTACDMSATGGTRCRLRGSYIIYGQDDLGYPSMSSPDPNNPLTGAKSCPAGSTDVVTGQRNWQNSYSCGKKCTAYVNYFEIYHACMVC